MVRDPTREINRLLDKRRQPAVSGGDGSFIGRIINFNSASISVGTTPTRLFSQAITLTEDAHVVVNVETTLTVTTACTVTMRFYIDGVKLTYEPAQVCTAAGKWQLCPQVPFVGVGSGDHTIEVYVLTSTSTVSVPAEYCYLHVYADGLSNGTFSGDPEIAKSHSVSGSVTVVSRSVDLVTDVSTNQTHSVTGTVTHTYSVTLLP